MKKILIGAIILSITLLVAGIIFVPKILNKEPIACTMEAKLCPDGSSVGRTGPNCEFTPCPSDNLIGGDRDEHGCIGSAGYSWCEPKNKCLRIWEESCYANAKQEIQYRLAQKYNKPVEEVVVKANKETDDYMVGSVSFSVKGLPPGAGGMFLAAKTGNMWKLVYDGNGNVPCEEIKQQYSFPQDMLAGFCD